ncbi:hypothetical protein ACFQDR_02360 [Sulfitobacter sediminilitoris]
MTAVKSDAPVSITAPDAVEGSLEADQIDVRHATGSKLSLENSEDVDTARSGPNATSSKNIANGNDEIAVGRSDDQVRFTEAGRVPIQPATRAVDL